MQGPSLTGQPLGGGRGAGLAPALEREPRLVGRDGCSWVTTSVSRPGWKPSKFEGKCERVKRPNKDKDFPHPTIPRL